MKHEKSPVENTIDPLEIDKFSELASRWWDTESEFKPLHEINPLRFAYINDRTPLDGLTVADIGCGGGILTESLARAGATVTGIDLSEAALDVAKLHAAEEQLSINYECIATEDYAYDHSATFDVVTCMEMLEHVPEPASIVNACSRLLKPGGSAFFSTLNRNGKSWLFAIVGAEYILNLLPRGTHDWQRFIKPSQLAQMTRAADLQVLNITGMTYNPFSKQYSTGSDISVNYLMHTIKAESAAQSSPTKK
ncbi:bifunctional 3-demethylubiquinol 3-O-methyltransferase/2-polyprenyl-6-hydroxyphenol methylase [Chromatiales bacterium (ex Bugula neritina AB1)]|nr:bifunctional 3-demethylubiquinol 3-O-methyltransferase/2-polyprenyl-6-hydroxyphenol methylase [Chromatiales bacterium (ex Bugula neritina AB1)]